MGNKPESGSQRYHEKPAPARNLSLNVSDSPTSSSSPAEFEKTRRPSNASLGAQTDNPSALRPRDEQQHRRTNSVPPPSTRAPPLPAYALAVSDRTMQMNASNLTLDTTSSTDGQEESSNRLLNRDDPSGGSGSEPDTPSLRTSHLTDKLMNEASEILPYLFLGGDRVAKSKGKLQEKGITHVLNVARTVCDNYHEGDSDLEYTSMNLADDVAEDIDHFMIQAIADIDRVRELGGRILVHCHLGISRSATLVIAYLMWLNGLKCEQAFAFVKDKRPIVNPNLGFLTHLMEFEARLKLKPSEPTLHRVAPHSAKDGTLVVKLVVMPDNSKRPVRPTVAHLDPRGAFLLHSPQDSTMYLWVGPDVGAAAASEAAARAALNRRASSTRVRESYEEAGRRVGRMMCKYEPAYRGCDLVQVPTNEHADFALAKDANPTSLAARFWRALGEQVGSKMSVDTLRNTRPKKRWSEDEDNGVVAYVNEASSARFALTDVGDTPTILERTIEEEEDRS